MRRWMKHLTLLNLQFLFIGLQYKKNQSFLRHRSMDALFIFFFIFCLLRKVPTIVCLRCQTKLPQPIMFLWGTFLLSETLSPSLFSSLLFLSLSSSCSAQPSHQLIFNPQNKHLLSSLLFLFYLFVFFPFSFISHFQFSISSSTSS